ncbi:hypothetical protein HMN09_00849300 [Mycena chlorophos]|uniref:DUF6534 domain-containing protein n=1 Tax=Mycena chlorophos TaxID=658473 RepID=A0A8H6SSV3_MYCCL|nr:hypothetical protein HMN09_00849300 [Mycena chlorophos]
MASSPLDDTYGIWLVALLFQSILYGMALLQVFLYFRWYGKDSWWHKGTVILITLLETIQSSLFFSGVYEVLITNFGNFRRPEPVRPEDKFIPLLILIISLGALGAGSAQVGIISKLGVYSQLAKTSAATNTQAALAFAADVMITGALWWRLKSSKTGFQSTNRLINFLIITAINRGLLTMLMALLNLVLFLVKPGTFDFMSVLLVSGKLYMNSMLAMLNTRAHARSLGGIGTVVEVDHGSSGGMHMGMGTMNGATSAPRFPTVTVSQQRVVHRDEMEVDPESSFDERKLRAI